MIHLKVVESRVLSLSFISVINDLKINGIFLAGSAVTKIPEQPSQYLVETLGPEYGPAETRANECCACQMIYFQTIKMIRNTSYQGQSGHSHGRHQYQSNIIYISINIYIFFLLFLFQCYQIYSLFRKKRFNLKKYICHNCIENPLKYMV